MYRHGPTNEQFQFGDTLLKEVGPPDDPGALLIGKAKVCGYPLMIEAIAVTVTGGTQRGAPAVADRFDALCRYLDGSDGSFMMIAIRGREYVIAALPEAW